MVTYGSPTIGVRLPEDSPVRAFLTDRKDRSHGAALATQIVTELSMWRDALALELARTAWTLPELGMLADIRNSTTLDMGLSTGRNTMLQADVWDATSGVEDSYRSLHGTDPADLIEKLGTLGPVETHALTDAISRWWETQANDDTAHSVEGWAKVGVRVVEDDR